MTKFYAIVTNLGAAKIANAMSLGTKLNITHMAVGDGGGSLPTPNASQTKLVNEVRRAAINSLTIDEANASQIIAEQVIPETEGGFWIREMGLFDGDGTLIAVCNTAETYKPLLQEGSGRTQRLRMILIVSSTDAITLKVDPSVVLATRQYVDESVLEVRQYADSLMAAHLKATDPHTQYAPKASPELTGTPKAPTAAAGNNTTQIATTAFVAAALAALAGSAPATLDTLKELADALGNDPNFSATVLNKLAGKMDIAKNGSDIADVSTFIKNLGLVDGLADGAIGRQVGFKRIESTQAFTPKAITQVVEAWLYAAGGGGGGVPAGSSTSCSVGSGGSAGSWIRFLIPASLLRSGVNITIGSPGTGGLAGGGTGGKGGDSLFGSFATAPGGPGGSYSTAAASGVSAGAGGQAAEPTLSGSATLIDSSRGESGFPGYLVNASSGSSGHGGSGPEGSGGAGASGDGSGKGSGGSGARTLTAETTAMAGGKGTGGLCLIREWA